MLFAHLAVKTAGRGAAAALELVPEKTFAAWEKKQSATTRAWIKTQGFKAKAGSFLLLPARDGSLARVLVGVSSPLSMWDLAALPAGLPKGSYALPAGLAPEAEGKLALGWLLGGYRFDFYKKGENKSVTLCLSKETNRDLAQHTAEAIAQARDLVTMPAQDMGPADLARAVSETGKLFGAKVEVIVGDDLLKKNYPAIHAVGRASPPSRAPRLIDLRWGNPKHPRVTLVGKGVCFDTGGLDLKNGSGMLLMRKDKSGAGTALGVARLVMQKGLPLRLRLLIPAVENAVSGDAFRPSDILTMRDGQKVEVGNTDAEGRLVLADALAEAMTEKPEILIDFASLTGAMRSAMGTDISPFFANDEKLAADLLAAGAAQEDPLWQLPLYAPYAKMLDTPFAEVNSCPASAYAQPIVAALFLQRFIGSETKWAHFDFMGWNLSPKAGRPEGGEAMALRAVFALLERRAAGG